MLWNCQKVWHPTRRPLLHPESLSDSFVRGTVRNPNLLSEGSHGNGWIGVQTSLDVAQHCACEHGRTSRPWQIVDRHSPTLKTAIPAPHRPVRQGVGVGWAIRIACIVTASWTPRATQNFMSSLWFFLAFTMAKMKKLTATEVRKNSFGNSNISLQIPSDTLNSRLVETCHSHRSFPALM